MGPTGLIHTGGALQSYAAWVNSTWLHYFAVNYKWVWATMETLHFLGLGLMVPGMITFVFLQNRGSSFAIRLAHRWLPSAVEQAAAFNEALGAIYRAPVRVAASATTHLGGWVVSGAVTYVAIRMLGGRIDFLSAIAIESLLGALRSATAFVPASIGVQEAGYATLTPLFGLGPEIGLAVSLLRRARDITIAVPVLLMWQAMEGQRAFASVDDPMAEP